MLGGLLVCAESARCRPSLPDFAMRIMGIDPGTIITGWGVVEAQGSRLTCVSSGVLRAGHGEIGDRLAQIYAGLATLIAEYRPDGVALERNFLARNVQSAFRLGEARGVAMAAVAAAGLPLNEYAPMSVKKTVVGYGRADKSQVQAGVARLLALDSLPLEDEADALGVALCYVLSGGFESKVQQALAAAPAPRRRPVRRRRGGG